MTPMHDYCPVTQFCKNCGAQESANAPLCATGSNLAAISHILAWRRFAQSDPALFRALVFEQPHVVPLLAAKDLKTW